MLDHMKAAAMTAASIVRSLFLTVSPNSWRYRYNDALYEIRHGDEWHDYVLDLSYDVEIDEDGDRNRQDFDDDYDQEPHGVRDTFVPYPSEGPDGERFNPLQD